MVKIECTRESVLCTVPENMGMVSSGWMEASCRDKYSWDLEYVVERSTSKVLLVPAAAPENDVHTVTTPL